MRIQSKRVLVVVGFMFAAAVAPKSAFCGIWDTVNEIVLKSGEAPNMEKILDHLPLLISKEDVVQQGGNWIIAEGHIVLTPTALMSFKTTTDFANGVAPEYTWTFGNIRSDKNWIRTAEIPQIAFDLIPSHPLFKDSMMGTLTYNEFVEQIQSELVRLTVQKGYRTAVLRPRNVLGAPLVEGFNNDPSHIVVSTQFNNDRQNCMTTFCSGNISRSDLTAESQRARLIETALTGKHVKSVQLGALISKHFQEELGVQPLDWQRASFEGNAMAVEANDRNRAAFHPATLSESVSPAGVRNYNGVGTRNLLITGLFAKAVAIPFPDMQWVQSTIQPGQEQAWIQAYSNTLMAALQEFIETNPSLFHAWGLDSSLMVD